ncbi:hypothetical protein GCM10027598_58510 [Amycolatopsis oliviviridis]|uniref:WXG100 family type VII secretion target n=1 Tax=Amycolatopsis oliviviridis TaxID=1471590 RepID=A0ABQ3LZ43_9PSEU|nr:WXG100 family type VII secretion target [Amycolatopsis oliviviridis]GHH28385.1 hypothetical protein GCM10017790_59150 [Amycolatopsis oliviviridis]
MEAPEPDPVDDPELQLLTADQLAQLINEVSPNVFYERAAAFDTAMARLEQVQDDLRRQTRNLWEAWTGRGADSFEELVQRVTGATGSVVQAMATPGYGEALRRTGDALAHAQQRIRDLQTQNRSGDVDATRQVLHDLGTAYRDIGVGVVPLPEAVTEQKQAAASGAAGGGGARQTVQNLPAVIVHPQTAGRPAGHEPGMAAPAALALAPMAASAFASGTGSVGRGSSAATPVSASRTDEDAVVPAVLGRGDAAVPMAMVLPAAAGLHTVGASVLGRTAKPAASRPAGAKQEHGFAKRERDRENAREERPEKVVSTSAGPELREASAPQKASAAAQPATTAAPAPVAPATSAAPATSTTPQVATAHATATQPLPPLQNAPDPGRGPVGSSALPGGALSADILAAPGKGPLEAALPASPAFRPVPGEAAGTTLPDTPLLAPHSASTGRAGDAAFIGGYGGHISRGAQGHEDSTNDHHPAGLLGADSQVWNASSEGALVLGRPVAPPPSVDESDRDPLPGKEVGGADPAASSLPVLGRPDSRKEN